MKSETDRLLDALVQRLAADIAERLEQRLAIPLAVSIADRIERRMERKEERRAATVVTLPSPAATPGDVSSPLVNLNEAMLFLRISRSHLYHLIDAEQIPTVKVGKRRLLRRADLEAFVKSA